jgi:hypothetical protein
MNIKEKIAGLGTKTLAIVAVLIVAVSAATVAYLSTAAITNATVQSPFEVKFIGVPSGMTISEDGLTVSMGTINGGSSYEVNATLENRANNPINAKTEINCEDATAPTCDIAIHHDNYVWTGTEYAYHAAGSYDLSCANGKYVIQSGYEFPAGHKSKSVVTFTPEENYVGSLSCEVQALPVN